MSNSMGNGMYLLGSQSSNFTVVKRFGVYNVYHKSGDHVAQCKTQREVRNAVRAYIIGDRTKTTEGRE